jgi:hypothetical protein
LRKNKYNKKVFIILAAVEKKTLKIAVFDFSFQVEIDLTFAVGSETMHPNLNNSTAVLPVQGACLKNPTHFFTF